MPTLTLAGYLRQFSPGIRFSARAATPTSTAANQGEGGTDIFLHSGTSGTLSDFSAGSDAGHAGGGATAGETGGGDFRSSRSTAKPGIWKTSGVRCF